MENDNALEQLKNQEQTALEKIKSERESAPRIYADLIDPDREPQAGDVEKLREVMLTLGLDLATVEMHAEARREAARLAALQTEIDALQPKIEKAGKAVIDEYETFKKLEREHVERRVELGRVSDGLRIEAARLDQNQKRIPVLQRKYPLAFGQEPPAPEVPQPLQHIHKDGSNVPHRNPAP